MPCSVSQRRHIFFLLFAAPFLMGMGIDLYVPSLPAITNYFGGHQSLVQLTIGLYMLGYGIGQIFLGILSDSLGRKKVFLASAFFYTFISFISAFSPNIYMLIICRFLQGIGIAGLGVIVRSIAVDCFVAKNLAKAFTYVSTSWALGPIVGPFIGGYLQHFFNWQADFYFFGLYGLFILIYAAITLPETNLFLQPLRPVKIARSIKTIITHPIFLLGTFILSLCYACIVLFNVVGPFLVQVVLKYSAVDYGHIALLLGFGYFAGNFLNRFAIKHFSPVRVASIALVLAFCMTLVMVILGIFIKLNLLVLILPIFLFLLLGFVFPNLMAKIIGFFPKNGGTANAIFGSLASVGVFVITTFAVLLKTNSQMPMVLTYVVLLLINLICFLFSRQLEKATSNAAD